MISNRLLRFATHRLTGTLFAIGLGIAVSAAPTLAALGQAPATLAPYDGPWTGHASCTVKTTYLDYEETQIHTWNLKNQPPLSVGGQMRELPATWTVTGSGYRKPSVTPRAATPPADTWKVTVRDDEAPLTVWELPGQNKLRIASRHGVHVGRGAVVSAHTAGGDISEWDFPKQDFPLTQATVTGSSMPRTFTDASRRPGWTQPAGATVTETCEWNFTRVGGQAQTTTKVDPPGPPARVAASAATNAGGRELQKRELQKEAIGRANIGVSSSPSDSCQALHDLVAQFHALRMQAEERYDQAIHQQENVFAAGGLTLAQQQAILNKIYALQAMKETVLQRLATEEAKVMAEINASCDGQSATPNSARNDEIQKAFGRAADALRQLYGDVSSLFSN